MTGPQVRRGLNLVVDCAGPAALFPAWRKHRLPVFSSARAATVATTLAPTLALTLTLVLTNPIPNPNHNPNPNPSSQS